MSDTTLPTDYEFREAIFDATTQAQVVNEINVVVASWSIRKIDTVKDFPSIESAVAYADYYRSEMTECYVIGGDILDG